MREAAIARLELEGELRHAIAHGELDVAFQPVVDVGRGRPVLLEALCRWHHPERGTLVAGDFIPIAEETGLISEIGTFVLTRSLETLARLQHELPMEPPLRLSVNVSGRQLASRNFPEQVAAILRKVDIIPGTLAIEITESVLLTSDLPLATLSALKDLGIVLMLDDFGTGYSSLSHLRHFPIDILKIDRSFVDGIDRDASKAKLVRGIVNLGDSLLLDVVAEGIERHEQADEFRDMRLPLAQGFLFSPPVAPDLVAAMLPEKRPTAALLK
jgi:EAL domain-containing protein (putative c-di-GMP-specific phosphodiesterase class I)